VRVRLNVWFPLLLIPFAYWFGWQMGVVCALLLLVIVLIHEFAHIFAARLTGGDGDEILLWPLGGLAFCHPAETFRAQFLTPAAGPLANLALCIAAFPAVWSSGLGVAAFNPLALPIAELSAGHLLRDLSVLTFSLSWVLLLLNLLPAFPLDGGQMLQAVLAERLGPATARQLSVRVGFFAGLALALLGLLADVSTVVFLGFFVLIMNLQEAFRLQLEDLYGEELARSDREWGHSDDGADEEAEPPEPRLSLWQRWKRNRAAARQERELEARAAAGKRLDELLDKINRLGKDALTAEEHKFLEQMSTQMRTQHERRN
jgi:Zn-dependent protease